MKIAVDRKSSVLASNAVHHRIDSLTSIVALVAIVGSHVLGSVSWLDPVGGLAVSMMVIRAGWGNTGSALLELADVGVAEEVKSSVRKAALKALQDGASRSDHNAIEVRDVQGIKAGQNYLVDVEVIVPGQWTVKETCLVEDTIRQKVGSKVRGVRRVRVRFVARNDRFPNINNEFIGADARGSPGLDDHGNSESYRRHDVSLFSGDAKK